MEDINKPFVKALLIKELNKKVRYGLMLLETEDLTRFIDDGPTSTLLLNWETFKECFNTIPMEKMSGKKDLSYCDKILLTITYDLSSSWLESGGAHLDSMTLMGNILGSDFSSVLETAASKGMVK